ncbi:MAG: ribonuclease III, partial [Eubacterium sp.]|nr:ribonuclease III [Eubacterium sp.]
MMRFTEKEINPKQLSPLNLAFIGDCVYEMLVRETLVVEANRPVNDLHRESVKYVSAKAQTRAYDKIKDIL